MKALLNGRDVLKTRLERRKSEAEALLTGNCSRKTAKICSSGIIETFIDIEQNNAQYVSHLSDNIHIQAAFDCIRETEKKTDIIIEDPNKY